MPLRGEAGSRGAASQGPCLPVNAGSLPPPWAAAHARAPYLPPMHGEEEQRRRRREQQRRKRELRREHARQTLALLAAELDQPSMSGTLIAFAEPLRRALLPQRHGLQEYETLLHAAALVWNAARAYEGERLEQGLAVAERLLAQVSAAPPRLLLQRLVHRRRTRHAQEARFVGGVEVLDEGGGEWRVLVAARPLPPPRHEDGSEEEVRPSSVAEQGAGDPFIV